MNELDKTVKFEDFVKLDIHVGRVVVVQPFPLGYTLVFVEDEVKD